MFLLQVQEVLVQEVPAKKESISLLDFIFSGGMMGTSVMVILLLASIISLAIFLERWLTLQKIGKLNKGFSKRINEKILDGKISDAQAICLQQDTVYSRLLLKGIERIGKPLDEIKNSLENTAKMEVYKLEVNIPTLATISGVGPMIGFLGTVMGMVLAFREMANAGGQVNVQMLSTGIYTALNTTIAGLIVGICSYVFYNILVSKVNNFVNLIEASVIDFLDTLNKPI